MWFNRLVTQTRTIMTPKQKQSLLKLLETAWSKTYAASKKEEMGETLAAIESAISSLNQLN
jgi:hypothetical protein